jgi:hypothetical protein
LIARSNPFCAGEQLLQTRHTHENPQRESRDEEQGKGRRRTLRSVSSWLGAKTILLQLLCPDEDGCEACGGCALLKGCGNLLSCGRNYLRCSSILQRTQSPGVFRPTVATRPNQHTRCSSLVLLRMASGVSFGKPRSRTNAGFSHGCSYNPSCQRQTAS